MPASDAALSGDTLTTVTLNYKWRALVVQAMEFYYSSPDYSEISIDNDDQLTAFIMRLYEDY